MGIPYYVDAGRRSRSRSQTLELELMSYDVLFGGEEVAAPKDVGELLEVYPDGSVWWSRQAHFTLACPFAANLGRMPFDTQTCNFMVGMYADTALDSQLRWKEGRVALANHDGTACLNEWFVTGFSQAQLVEKAPLHLQTLVPRESRGHTRTPYP